VIPLKTRQVIITTDAISNVIFQRPGRNGADPGRVAVEPGYHPLNNAWAALQAFEPSA
jgi:hypothetical protein